MRFEKKIVVKPIGNQLALCMFANFLIFTNIFL